MLMMYSLMLYPNSTAACVQWRYARRFFCTCRGKGSQGVTLGSLLSLALRCLLGLASPLPWAALQRYLTCSLLAALTSSALSYRVEKACGGEGGRNRARVGLTKKGVPQPRSPNGPLKSHVTQLKLSTLFSVHCHLCTPSSQPASKNTQQ